jgi:hypothetical protein
MAIVAVILAFIWTMLPLIGWNEYTIEVKKTLNLIKKTIE